MILTQKPLKETMEDFWSLVVQETPAVVLYFNEGQVRRLKEQINFVR